MSDAPAEAAAEALAEGVLVGDRRALARVLTAIENRTALAERLVRRLYSSAGRANLVGITGPPGSGKSTLVAALIATARAAGRSVAVVAVDPSSPITGGALLGDRVRMQAHAGDPDVFIRSMASRGHAGGLAPATIAAATVLAAAGFDLVLIETVGTGQGEVEIAASADVTVVLEAPESGDEIQAIKAGLLEVADIVVVNKGDRPGAARTAAGLRAMLAAGRVAGRGARGGAAGDGEAGDGEAGDGEAGDGEAGERGPGAGQGRAAWHPKILITTATTGEGVHELLEAIDGLLTTRTPAGGHAGLARAEAQVWAILAERVRDRVRVAVGGASIASTLAEVAAHRLDPYAAADRLLGMAGDPEAGSPDAGSRDAADRLPSTG